MTITKKADMADRLKLTAERLAKISETIDEIRDEWEEVRAASVMLASTANATRDMLDAYALMGRAYAAEARRKAASI